MRISELPGRSACREALVGHDGHGWLRVMVRIERAWYILGVLSPSSAGTLIPYLPNSLLLRTFDPQLRGRVLSGRQQHRHLSHGLPCWLDCDKTGRQFLNGRLLRVPGRQVFSRWQRNRVLERDVRGGIRHSCWSPQLVELCPMRPGHVGRGRLGVLRKYDVCTGVWRQLDRRCERNAWLRYVCQLRVLHWAGIHVHHKCLQPRRLPHQSRQLRLPG